MSQYPEEQYGQYASPEQQGFYQSGFTLDEQVDPSQQQQQQWAPGGPSYYSAPPPPHQSHVYAAEGYGEQSKIMLADRFLIIYWHVDVHLGLLCLV